MTSKQKLFLIKIDFDGAFDLVSRSVLIRKLYKFGAGSIFVTCIASMYLNTNNVIFQGEDQIFLSLYAGIKQGLPLSPMLFLFHVNDIFAFFKNIYTNTNTDTYSRCRHHSPFVSTLLTTQAEAGSEKEFGTWAMHILRFYL